jgi:hypothetical protein
MSVSLTSKEKGLTIAVATAEIWFTYQGSEGYEGMTARTARAARTTPTATMGLKAQVAVTIALYVGLFFVEYPPIFILGYWGWGAVVHKIITGVLIALNLVVTQYAARRLGLFRRAKEADLGDADGRNVLA